MNSRLPALLLLNAVVLLAAGDSGRIIRVRGEATVHATPDQVGIEIAVVDTEATAQSAAAKNAAVSTRVQDSLDALLHRDGSYKTVAISVEPQYNWEQNKQTLAGFRATNTITVELNNLQLIGPVIDTALSAGATNIGNIVFKSRDETEARHQALAQATLAARGDADAIAKALHVNVTGIVSADTEPGGPLPVAPRQFVANELMAPKAATPVTPNAVDIHAAVSLTLSVE